MGDNGKIILFISDFESDVDSVTDIIGSSPTYARLKGDLLLNGINKARRSTWALYSSKVPLQDYEQHEQLMIRKLSNIKSKESIPSDWDVSFAIFISKKFDGLNISKEFIKIASILKANFEVVIK